MRFRWRSAARAVGQVAAFLLFFAPPAVAQRNLTVSTATDDEKRVALVIGNGAYKDSPLANPVNDASDISRALRAFGFKVILKRNASSREMRQAIRQFGADLRRADVGLFYFAGHGVQVRGSNYLVPVGAEIESEADAEDLAIDAGYAMRTMEEAQVKVSIVILDACRNNPFARSFRSASRGLAQMNAATGSLIAFATAPGSVAGDGVGRNGIYTKHLLASLTQSDTDILKVFQRTRAGVVKETAGKQTPWESTSLIGDFYFRPGPAALAAVPALPAPSPDAGAIELAFWESIRASTNAANFQEYLSQFPSGRFAGLARNRIAELSAAATSPPQVAAVAPPSIAPPSPAAPPPSGARQVTFMTGPQGGSWIPLGSTLKGLWERSVPELYVVQTPGAGIANVRGIAERKAQVGFANSNTTVDGLQGRAPYAGRVTNVCQVANLYPQYFHVVALKSARIDSFANLKGKSLVTQPRGNTGELLTDLALRLNGLSYQSLSRINFQATYTDAVSMMKDGQVQVFTLGASAPASAVMDLASARDISIVPVDDGTMSRLKQMNPGYNKLIIKAGTYPQQDQDVPVIGYSTHIVAACDLPEHTVYQMTKAMASNVDAMATVVKSIDGIRPKDMALDIGVPLHSGAARFYREAGAL